MAGHKGHEFVWVKNVDHQLRHEADSDELRAVADMVAMTPLITVQLMGLVAQLKTRKARSAQPLLDPAALLAELPDDAIIEL